MKTQRIQQPERYEAPKVKVKELRKRSMLMATSEGFSFDNGGTEGTEEQGGSYNE